MWLLQVLEMPPSWWSVGRVLGLRHWQPGSPVPVRKAGGTGASRRCLSPDRRVA